MLTTSPVTLSGTKIAPTLTEFWRGASKIKIRMMNENEKVMADIQRVFDRCQYTNPVCRVEPYGLDEYVVYVRKRDGSEMKLNPRWDGWRKEFVNQ